MRIQPRQQLLEIWRATARSSYQNGRWVWGGRDAPNSINDAEQLLCLILPATQISSFRLDNPDETDDEVIDALRAMGNAAEIPQRLVAVLAEYFDRYSADDGTPLFHGGSYFTTLDPDEKPAPTQLELDVVESYAVSITLTLAAISFARSFNAVVTRNDLKEEASRLEQMASRRLTAAMVGLLRSFTISAFDVDSSAGRSLVAMVNQVGLPDKQFTSELTRRLQSVTAGLKDLTIVSGQVRDLDSPGRLYECGWSWGVIQNAPDVEFVQDPYISQPAGYAQDAPYLYFTVVALDGLADLFSPRTRLQRLLDELQQRLSAALSLRWDFTQAYWSAIASFGGAQAQWPLEDLPWRATDGAESDYFSLLVTSIAARDLAERRGVDVDLSRLGQILGELANRARITRRLMKDDSAIQLHSPGVSILLEGSEVYGPKLAFQATDFSPLLLKRAVRVAELITDIKLRGELLDLMDRIWDHVVKRRHSDDTGRDSWHGLWDQPANVYPAVTEPFDQPSWHHTVRVVESLLSSAWLTTSKPLQSDEVIALASYLLAEAEHLFDQEQLAGSTEAGPQLRGEVQSVQASISRAREILIVTPGSATALLQEALRKLDQLAAARQGASGRW